MPYSFTPVRSLFRAVRALGWRNGLRYAIRRIPEYSPLVFRSYAYQLKSPLLGGPVECRRGTSDIRVFQQVFIEQQYRCVGNVLDPQLVIDCGANVGYSCLWFLSQFPNTHVIAIEPDEANFGLLLRNVSPFGDRVTPINSAVWSHPCELVLSNSHAGIGSEWSRQVCPANADDDGKIPAVDVGTLLARSGHERISILKVDIEGAEKVVFGNNPESWIRCVDNIVIELHGEDARRVFRQAVSPFGCEISRSGELTICRFRH